MKVRRLQLESWQMARISIKTQMAHLNIDSKIRRGMNVQRQHAHMNVDREYPSLDVDMESLWTNLGLKDIGTFAQDYVQAAYSQAKQGIKNIENNGDAVAALPHRGNVIAQIARSNMLRVRQPVTSGRAVDPTVSIKSDPGSLSINWSLEDITISWDEYQSPVITIDPKPSITVELAQEPRVQFKVVEMSIPPEAGRTIDEEI